MFAECSEFCKNLQHDVIIVAVYVLQALHTACEMSDTERHAHMPMLLDPDDSGRVQPGLALSSRTNGVISSSRRNQDPQIQISITMLSMLPADHEWC